MKTIKDALDKYPDEMFVNSSKCKAICKIIAAIQRHEKVEHHYHRMLDMTTELERRK